MMLIALIEDIIKQKKQELSRRERASGYMFCRSPAVQAVADEIALWEKDLIDLKDHECKETKKGNVVIKTIEEICDITRIYRWLHDTSSMELNIMLATMSGWTHIADMGNYLLGYREDKATVRGHATIAMPASNNADSFDLMVSKNLWPESAFHMVFIRNLKQPNMNLTEMGRTVFNEHPEENTRRLITGAAIRLLCFEKERQK